MWYKGDIKKQNIELEKIDLEASFVHSASFDVDDDYGSISEHESASSSASTSGNANSTVSGTPFGSSNFSLHTLSNMDCDDIFDEYFDI